MVIPNECFGLKNFKTLNSWKFESGPYDVMVTKAKSHVEEMNRIELLTVTWVLIVVQYLQK